MKKIRISDDRLFDITNSLLLMALMIVTIYPILYSFFSSISKPYSLMAYNGILWRPLGFSLDAYKEIVKNPDIMTGYMNTIINVSVGTGINLFLTILGAYVLSKKYLLWHKPIMLLIIFTMYFQGGLIPLYNLVLKLGLMNTRWAVLLPIAMNTFNLIIMRTSFSYIPESLFESAYMDGANHIQILVHIAIRTSTSIIAVIALFYSVHHWNAWLLNSLFIRNRGLYPLQLILREILILNNTETMLANINALEDREPVADTIKHAIIIVATLPILALYPFLQKYFVKGVFIGSIKE